MTTPQRRAVCSSGIAHVALLHPSFIVSLVRQERHYQPICQDRQIHLSSEPTPRPLPPPPHGPHLCLPFQATCLFIMPVSFNPFSFSSASLCVSCCRFPPKTLPPPYPECVRAHRARWVSRAVNWPTPRTLACSGWVRETPNYAASPFIIALAEALREVGVGVGVGAGTTPFSLQLVPNCLGQPRYRQGEIQTVCLLDVLFGE